MFFVKKKKNPNRPRSSSSPKWNNILKDIWENRKHYEGSGVIVIPSDPNTLLERLDLLLVLCTYPVLPSSVHVCIYFDWFPLWLFLELDFLLQNIVLDVSGPFYSLITRNYGTDFNMNFLDVSLLL